MRLSVVEKKPQVLNIVFDFCLNMLFNCSTLILPFLILTMSNDSKIIETLGGPTKVSDLLGYEKKSGPQRVHNWITRGIPPKVKLERPDLFLNAPTVAPKAEQVGASYGQP